MNGYTNRDTWLVVLWLENDRKNYESLKRNVNNLIKTTSDTTLKTSLKNNFKYGDRIVWSNVDCKQIRKYLKEFKEDHDL
jgi:hypothetical protein